MTDEQMSGLYNAAATCTISFSSFKAAIEAIEAHNAALESRVLAERKEPECTCNSNPHAETCPVTAHVRTLLKESGENAWAKANGYAAVTNFGDPVLAHPTPDDAKDAARYRWLRDTNKRMHYTSDFTPEQVFDLIQIEVRVEGEPVFTPEGHFDFASELDRAIDRARQSGEEGNE